MASTRHLVCLCLLTFTPTDLPAQQRARARALGVKPGTLSPGPRNAITDVAGVLIGHATVREGD